MFSYKYTKCKETGRNGKNQLVNYTIIHFNKAFLNNPLNVSYYCY